MSTGKLDCYGVTDAGRQRIENEDQFLIADLVKAVRVQTTSLSLDDHTEVTGHSLGKIFLVADGIGEQAAGRRASTLAVDETISFMVNRMRWSAFSPSAQGKEVDERLSTDLKAALAHCQQRILNEAQWNSEKQGMGTALTVAILDWPSFRVVHAGTCHCFLHHGETLSDLTRPGPETGETAPTDALHRATPDKVIGGPTVELSLEIYDAEVSIGDTLLLCTDGLTAHVGTDAIANVLRRQSSAEQVCTELVELANNGGGSDNVTVVAARFLDPEREPASLEADVALQRPKSQHRSDDRTAGQGNEVAVKTRGS